MNPILINVNKQMDGYTLSITPTIREFIKRLFPGAHLLTIYLSLY
jgi:hypothetical protein